MKGRRGGKRGGKRGGRRPGKRGLTTKGKGSQVNDVAAVSEFYRFNDGNMETVYWDYTCSLQQHVRASAVAQGYQEYRIKLITYKLKPLSDTYTAAAGSARLPYLYYIIDKVRANNNLLTLDGFEKAGAKPIRFDDKTITIKYKPSVLVDNYDAATGGGVPRQYRISPWLSTNDQNTNPGLFVPSGVDHNGVRWIIDGQSADFTYSIERQVDIEFRKPMWNELPGETEVLKASSVEVLMPVKGVVSTTV